MDEIDGIDEMMTKFPTTKRGKAIPRAVIASVMRKKEPEKILVEIEWDGLNGCFYFMLGTMFVGVETDGYMHT